MASFGPFLPILSNSRERRRKRKEKVQFVARPQRRAIKWLGYHVERMLLPMIVMMLSMELGNAMPFGHWQMRGENDGAYGSTLPPNQKDLVHPVRSFTVMKNIFPFKSFLSG